MHARIRRAVIAAALAGAFAAYTPAAAHVVLADAEAPAGSYYKAGFRVPHGCDGSPTTAVAVTIPDGILVAKPQPKPGWTLTVERSPLPTPVAGPHGRAIAERVVRIVWQGGELPDAWFDEFAVHLRLPDAPPGTVLHFPVDQTCLQGARHWVGTGGTAKGGADGHAGHGPDPAPALRLTAGRHGH